MVIIETDRLILRKWREEDLDPFSLINADARVMEYFPYRLTREEIQAFIERSNKQIDDHGYGLFACELKDAGIFLGCVGLAIPTFEADFTPCVDIGWRLAFDYWGRGYATQAAKAVLKFGFEAVGLNEILSWTVPENIRSRNVMERIGMKQDKASSFYHPRLPEGHPLSLHLLYRISKV